MDNDNNNKAKAEPKVVITPRPDLGDGLYSFVVLPFHYWGHIETTKDGQFEAHFRGSVIARADALHILQENLYKSPKEWETIINQPKSKK